MTINNVSPMATDRVRKEYRVIVKLGADIVDVSAYNEDYAMKTAYQTIVEAYGIDLAEQADYLVREIQR